MATPAESPRAANLPPSRQSRFNWRRVWLILPLAGTALALGYVAFLFLKWPFTEQSLIDVLQERSVREVRISRFTRTYWPPGCVAEGIRFLHRRHKNKPPLITIDKLSVEATYPGLLLHRRLSKVRAIGMHLIVPPRQPNGKPNPIPLTQTHSTGPALVIGRVIADGTILDFISQDPKKKPFRLIIDKLGISGVGNNRPLAYRAIISNTLPPGKIRSSGMFGPWNPDDPAVTTLSGTYTYDNVNLAVFHAISGTLASTGKFSGTLGQLAITGSARVPNFHIVDTSHTTSLSTEFQASVDATAGDTTLQSVVAHFGRTTTEFKGTVSGRPGEDGKTISLDMASDHGRIEDLLDLFIEARRAPMTGDVSFRGHVEVPASSQQFLRKLLLSGDFGIGAGRFTNRQTQNTINRLGQTGKKGRSEIDSSPDSETALSNLRGHVVARNGVASLSNLSFRVPEAIAWMHGLYGLIDYKIDLRGHLFCDHPSDAATGFKSLFLKALSPFLRKSGKQKIVPFKITGTFQKPNIALDLNSTYPASSSRLYRAVPSK